MNMQIVTLIALVLAIFIGFKRKINTGLLGILFAFILGQFMLDINGKEIIKGFPTNLFFTLLGMTFLFSIAKVNGTLELISKKVCLVTNGNTKLLPIIFFVMSGIISAFGPGAIVITALMAPIAMQLSEEENISPLLMGIMVIAGSIAGGLSPLSPSGIVANSLSAENGVLNTANSVFLGSFIFMTIFALIFYIVLKGYKLPRNEKKQNDKLEFNGSQKMTIVILIIVIIGILILKWDIGLTAFAGSTILLLLKVADEKKSIDGIPWGTLILISGMAILVNVVSKGGGIDALSDILMNFMTQKTATALIGLIAGLMSAVSSASGVVMPTLIPVAKNMSGEIGISSKILITALVTGAHTVTFSPLSTLGALILASASEKVDKQKLFTQLMGVAVLALVISAILGLIGVYNIL